MRYVASCPLPAKPAIFVFVLLRHLPEVVKIEIVGFAHLLKAFDTLCASILSIVRFKVMAKELTGSQAFEKAHLDHAD